MMRCSLPAMAAVLALVFTALLPDHAPAQVSGADKFAAAIAPLLARHCLECHGAETPKARLDLSQKQTALAGGKSGPAIVPGKAAESLLWKLVAADKMPKNRPPLSADEKRLLQEWVDAGAPGSDKVIQPAGPSDLTSLGLRRLTVREYIQTVRSAVGVDIEDDARRLLPADLRADGFSNTAYNLNVDLAHVEAYARLAEVIASRIDPLKFAAGFSPRQDLGEEHMRTLIAALGKWLLRGPLDDREIATYLAVSQAVAKEGGDYAEAVRYIVEAMLQSPRFLYRLEHDPRQPSGFALASRLSYILWGGPPDHELLRAAEAGELDDRQLLARQVERMLNDPQAIEQSTQFIAEWMHLDRLPSMRPSKERFPRWDDRLAADMRAETLAFFRHVAWEERRPLKELLNAQVTFATPRLARHYGLTPSAAAPEPANVELVKQPQRVSEGLQVLYTFREGSGAVVHDVSGNGNLPLKIADPSAVRWGDHGLTINSPTLIASDKPPAALIETLQRNGGLTLEAWITPANNSQSGPARIVTLSSNPSQRNFTLGQAGDLFEIRLRTTSTSPNGEPSLRSAAGAAGTSAVHVVYTFDKSGEAVVYIDGRESGRKRVGGDFRNWEKDFRLALGNELSRDRAWAGTLHLVGIYARPLSVEEVKQNLAAGLSQAGIAASSPLAAPQRSPAGLQAVYSFTEGSGNIVRDVAGVGEPLDLTIESPSDVVWTAEGLQIKGPSLLATAKAPQRLLEAIKAAHAVTLEAWITPADAQQAGPARIVTLSSGIGQRNFTLGQDGNKYDVRLRTTRTDANGMPSLASPSGAAEARRTHLVFTRDAAGQAKLYVDGKEQAARDFAGDFSHWDGSFRLMLANESSRDRAWRGTLHRVAIYSRALSADEIQASDAAETSASLARYDLTNLPSRGGLLTQGSVLSIGGDEASMVTRGLFMLRELLYSGVDDPPPCVDTTPVPPKPGLTQRAIAMQRIANQACSDCHGKFESLAFGLEKFDGVGGWHEVDEHGNQLREDGEVVFPDVEKPVPYRSSAELMDLLANSPRVQMAITRKVTQFALGRPLVRADEPVVESIHAQAMQNGGTYASLITAIVMSDLVQPPATEKNR